MQELLYKIINQFINKYKNMQEFSYDYENIKDKSFSDLGMDSLDILNMIFEIEEYTMKDIDWSLFAQEDIKNLQQLSIFLEKILED